MNETQNEPKTPPAPGPTRLEGLLKKVFGRFGLLWAAGFTVLATLLRWSTDGFLGEASPFTFYFLSVVLTALVTRLGPALVAVILGAFCGQFLWVTPRLSMALLNTSQVAQLLVYLAVATSCALAVVAARVLRLVDYIDTSDD